jgi:hypothetical protein
MQEMYKSSLLGSKKENLKDVKSAKTWTYYLSWNFYVKLKFT